jgi:tetratricopeptide (TPR) repeat protein
MTPRPLPSENAPFEPALSLAREGRLEEACDALAAAVPGEGRGPGRGAGALAYAEVARLAEVAGDVVTALRAMDEAVLLAPTYADLHYQRACLLVAQQQRAPARKALQKALSINPRYVAARLELALLDAREGLLTESLAALRSLEAERRVDEPRAFQRGLKSLARAEWDEAGAQLKSALKVSDAVVDRALADYHAKVARGEHTEALHALRDAVTAHPGYPDLHYLLGCSELEAGMTDDAVASLARTLELHPDLHAARVQLARALETLGDLAQAGEQVALVLAEDPEHPQALELQDRWSRRRDVRARGVAGRDLPTAGPGGAPTEDS